LFKYNAIELNKIITIWFNLILTTGFGNKHMLNNNPFPRYYTHSDRITDNHNLEEKKDIMSTILK
jgi:hypothetical protein